MEILISTGALFISVLVLGKASRAIILAIIKNPIRFSNFELKSNGNGGKDLIIFVKGKQPKVINV